MNEIRIPRLGWSMEEGVFVGWLKKDGEQVAVGDPLFEMEGEKAAQEIESVDAGRLQIAPNAPQPGDEVKVGALLGHLLAAGEVAPTDDAGPQELKDVEQTVAFLNQSAGARPTAARARASDTNDDVWNSNSNRAARGDSYGGEITRDAEPVATPRAKRVAAEVGVDWSTLQGSGRDGRIREADVREAASTRPVTSKQPTRTTVVATPTPAGRTAPITTGMSARRKAIAERLRMSRERTIPVTLTTAANASNIVALREQFKATNSKLVPALTDIVACLVARVLKRHPQMTARWQDDESGRALVAVGDDIAIGIAVDTADGLLVPVVNGVARRSLLRVTEETRSLIERARSGRLTSAEMHGGVLTISNLGAQGIDGFTPIINYPEIAILGLGAIRREAVVLDDDRIAPQARMTLSLTFDHAAIDGAPAAAFLKDVASAIENPAALLLGE